jgi:dolichol kinase
MDAATLNQTGDLASELFALLRETDPSRAKSVAPNRVSERWSRIQASVDELAAETSAPAPVVESVATLRALMHDSGSAESSGMGYWLSLRPHLMATYERLAGELRRRSVRAPTLRPTNWTRIGFHVSSALGSLLLLEVLLSRTGTLWATGAFAVYCWTNEAGRAVSKNWNARLMKNPFFSRIIHPHEHHHVNSATWYGTALVILAVVSPPFASAAALAVLGFGDPAAGLVGRRWGRTPLAAGRTLEGTLTFAVFGCLASFAVLSLWHGAVAWPLLLAISAAAGAAGAIAEAVSVKLDDNLTVPLAAAAAAALVAFALGIQI